MSELPLISCICPTSGKRAAFLGRAISMFLAQDYPNKELVIIDEPGHNPFGYMDTCDQVIPAHESIFYTLVDGDRSLIDTLTIGAKRNLACSLAHGEIIAFVDDDDVYFPSRLSEQVQPILDGRADVTAMKMRLLLRTRDTTLWQCGDAVHKMLFSHDVKCGTLMFRASYLDDSCYPNISQGEDYRFLCTLLGRGARLARISSESYICVRHGDNVTADIEGLEQPGWKQVPIERYLSREEVAFYAGLREGVARV